MTPDERKALTELADAFVSGADGHRQLVEQRSRDDDGRDYLRGFANALDVAGLRLRSVLATLTDPQSGERCTELSFGGRRCERQKGHDGACLVSEPEPEEVMPDESVHPPRDSGPGPDMNQGERLELDPGYLQGFTEGVRFGAEQLVDGILARLHRSPATSELEEVMPDAEPKEDHYTTTLYGYLREIMPGDTAKAVCVTIREMIDMGRSPDWLTRTHPPTPSHSTDSSEGENAGLVKRMAEELHRYMGSKLGDVGPPWGELSRNERDEYRADARRLLHDTGILPEQGEEG